MPTNPAVLLPLAGGFVYFDAHGGVCKVFAVSARQPHEHAVYGTRTRSFPSGQDEGTVGAESEVSELRVEKSLSLTAAASAAHFAVAVRSAALGRARVLQFEAPLPLPRAAQRALGDRLRPVTLAVLLERGARGFAFITPGEEIDGDRDSNER